MLCVWVGLCCVFTVSAFYWQQECSTTAQRLLGNHGMAHAHPGYTGLAGTVWCVSVCGGQKCRWNDLVQCDLMKCGFEHDWRKLAQSRAAWRAEVEMLVRDLNREAEMKDDKKKDEKKRNQQVRHATALALLVCDHPNCGFVAVKRSGLVNHKRQKHSIPNLPTCKHCRKSFHAQGLANHERFCAKKH